MYLKSATNVFFGLSEYLRAARIEIWHNILTVLRSFETERFDGTEFTYFPVIFFHFCPRYLPTSTYNSPSSVESFWNDFYPHIEEFHTWCNTHCTLKKWEVNFLNIRDFVVDYRELVRAVCRNWYHSVTKTQEYVIMFLNTPYAVVPSAFRIVKYEIF